MEYLIFVIAQALLFGAFSWKFYTAAGRQAWEAFVPVYNTFVLLRIIERPRYWIVLYIIPVVGNVLGIVMLYELLHVFRFRKTWQTAAAVGSLGLYLAYLNYKEPLKYHGRDDLYIKATLGEMVNSVFFAVIVATVIRSTTFEAYTIPTSSMEKSLMVGDFLFVSKVHYGIRVPMTPMSVPLIHNRMPWMRNVPSYSKYPQIPYLRLPALDPIEVGDPVVFNYPMDLDPVDKKENYVKRCVGVAGDSLAIVDRTVLVNGVPFRFPDRSHPQFLYYVETNGTMFDPKVLKEKFDINFLNREQVRRYPNDQDVIFVSQTDAVVFLQERFVEDFGSLPNVKALYPVNAPKPGTPQDTTLPEGLKNFIANEMSGSRSILFPNPNTGHGEQPYKDTPDNFGPIYIPKAGATVALTPFNIDAYRRIIDVYEGHDLRIQEDGVYIDGALATEYTFEQNYYWMMGDNRHNSLDSRYWGYVPEDHIVGKPVFIWMSYDKHKGSSIFEHIRTERVFTTVNGSGERVSYFWYFVAAVVLFQVFMALRKKKKKASAHGH